MRWADKRNIILLHVSFWVLFLAFKFFDYTNDIPRDTSAKLIICQYSFSIVAAYVHYFFLLPLLLVKEKRLTYFLWLAVLLTLCIMGRGWLESIVLSGVFNTDYYTNWTAMRVLNLFWSTSSFVVFIALMKFTIDRFVLENQKRELENEKLNAELNYLKAQINPHFLFNTLHNLNYLSQIKSDQATEVILKLSNIMRYMIYDSNKEKVELAKEISYIKDYLVLESIRLNNKFDLKFDASQANQQLEIVPLIIIPFVENAFKHGISDQQKENWIHVRLHSEGNLLHLEVENSLLLENSEQDVESGFGLNNLKRRLSLCYPERHKLEIEKRDDRFSVHLTLKIS